MTVRPECKWFNDDLLAQKWEVRRLKSVKENSGLTVDTQMYEAAAHNYCKSKDKYKKEYYIFAILLADGNQSALF